ncbi:MAG: HAD family hydrolase [Sandaracinaceae bacterium]|nr:HAD family hydrolase [Sandaracinaceae bacterium]
MSIRFNPIEHVVFDFDGTCTDIPAIAENFLRDYHAALNATVFRDDPISDAAWRDALEAVRRSSPDAGWTLETTPSAPAAADPYILSYEAAQRLRRQRGATENVSAETFKQADDANPAPLRPELKTVLGFLQSAGARVTFISNSSTKKVVRRLAALFEGSIPDFIGVQSGASKYKIAEPVVGAAELSEPLLSRFLKLPAAVDGDGLARPLYLRRAYYASAIDSALAGDGDALERTLFCGDIWEMDLAMPFHLGACVHLIERAPPYDTYPFERAAVVRGNERARASDDLDGLRAWF